ncbi:MAG TPA: malto-oligosyltrehalose synthase [Vicinamibacterales bacterium]
MTASVQEPVRRPDRPSRVPISLYRIQLNRNHMTFDGAYEQVDYLHALGITDLYISPCLMAGRDSTHGYDITDHGQLNPDLGGEEALNRLVAALKARDMGLVMDWVPNHMGLDTTRNRWWRDVLENGQSSPHARAFDIDWTPVKRELEGKVLLPILGDQYGRVLERGELNLVYEDGAFTIEYGPHRLPVSPRSSVTILQHDLERLEQEAGEDRAEIDEFLSVLKALEHLPPSRATDHDSMIERQREKEVARRRLAQLTARSAVVRNHVERAVAAFRGTPGDAASYDRLHELLETQNYRLSYWRTAADEINYRRFFDVNELAGVRMEDPHVFDEAHALVLRLIAESKVTGLRLDHPDGLFDPVGYVDRLQQRIAESGIRGEDPTRPLYIAVEKILSPGELLLADWAVHGTTTYRFLNLVNSLFVDPSGAVPLRRFYERMTGNRESYADLVYRCKKLIMLTSMASELNVLSHALNDLSESDRHSRDFTLNGLRKALLETIACFPIYRTYVSPRGVSARDRDIIHAAVNEARRRNPALEASIFDFLLRVLLPFDPPSPERGFDPLSRERRLAFAMKLQQYTGPVHAKGVEDTAFYRYNVLVSLNEVGGEPHQFGRTVDEFHAANALRRQRWPLEMIGTATHDTKRGEDLRVRIAALSEIVDPWRRLIARITRINAPHRSTINGQPAPDRNDEYLFYQTLTGVWPAEPADAPIPERAPEEIVERVDAYMLKAIKEAKVHTSWVAQDPAYEDALRAFVEGTLTGATSRRFLAAFVPFVRTVSRLGMINSLSQVALKMTAPGVVDFYQGGELWDLSLVDPDNRRPVDYGLRRAILAELEPLLSERDPEARTAGIRGLLDTWYDGRCKMFLVAALLRARRAASELFIGGTYDPLPGTDERCRRHLVAFARRHQGSSIIVVAPRLVAKLVPSPGDLPVGEEVWHDGGVQLPADLEGATFEHLLTGERFVARPAEQGPVLLAADLLRHVPVAVLQQA